MIAAALLAGALTAGSFAAVILYSRWPHGRFERLPEEEIIAMVTTSVASGCFVLSAWLVKVKRRWYWRVFAGLVAMVAIAFALLTAMLLSRVEGVGQLAAAYMFLIIALLAASAAFNISMRRKRAEARPTP